jgi:16S rRNA (guanine527-N7)-methyltransferase
LITIIQKYFDDLNSLQIAQFGQLQELYTYWNAQINVVSRKDIGELHERHVLHSLAIAKVLKFAPNTNVLDVGCGGGFPGVPLAIMFPEVQFHLVDSIGKKIKVVSEISKALNLKNVRATHARAETIRDKYEFVVSRAVTEFPLFYKWVQSKFSAKQFNALPNGILYLKGGDLKEELKTFEKRVVIYPLNEFFDESFFETKKVVYLPM